MKGVRRWGVWPSGWGRKGSRKDTGLRRKEFWAQYTAWVEYKMLCIESTNVELSVTSHLL